MYVCLFIDLKLCNKIHDRNVVKHHSLYIWQTQLFEDTCAETAERNAQKIKQHSLNKNSVNEYD